MNGTLMRIEVISIEKITCDLFILYIAEEIYLLSLSIVMILVIIVDPIRSITRTVSHFLY